MEHSRQQRFEPQTVPLTWEIPALVVAGSMVLFVLTALVVQAAVAWAVSGRFAWPTNLFDAVVGLAGGDFGVGLPDDVVGRLPGSGTMWILAVVGEIAVFAVAVLAGLRIRDVVVGTARRNGLATASQAAEALGASRLRRSARVIRPDRYGRRGRRVEVGCMQRADDGPAAHDDLDQHDVVEEPG